MLLDPTNPTDPLAPQLPSQGSPSTPDIALVLRILSAGQQESDTHIELVENGAVWARYLKTTVYGRPAAGPLEIL